LDWDLELELRVAGPAGKVVAPEA
jgi:hypothetical protein